VEINRQPDGFVEVIFLAKGDTELVRGDDGFSLEFAIVLAWLKYHGVNPEEVR